METAEPLALACKEYMDTGRDVTIRVLHEIGSAEIGASYFVDFLTEQQAAFLEFSGERVLDIGCGTGRVAIPLINSGRDVLGVDISETMVELARRREVNAVKMDVGKDLPAGPFDTVIMYGNGFGLLGTLGRTKDLLIRLRDITTPDAIIIAETENIEIADENTKRALKRALNARNVKRGAYAGQRTFRYAVGNTIGPECEWVFVDPETVKRISEEAGWYMSRGPAYWGKTAQYVFTLEKNQPSGSGKPSPSSGLQTQGYRAGLK